MRGSALIVLASWFAAATASADTELKNDGFNSGGTAGFQQGFVSGEMGASRFIAPSAGLQLLRVQLLYGGGSTATRTVTVHVFDDTAGTNAPGAELYSGDFQLMGSDNALQEIPITDMTVNVTQQFRVAIEFHDAGSPSIARDADNTIDQNKNFIFANPGGWIKSSTAGLSGDWVIRAFVSGGGASVDAPGGDAGVMGGESCNSNPDCPSGEFCDTAAHACTFDCRVDDDCGGGTCNSLGQCVGGEGGGGGGGCCQTDRGGGELGVLLLGLIAGAVLVLRRKR